MIVCFRNRATEDVFNGENTQRARQLCPRSVWNVATRKLDQLDSAARFEDLKVPPGNRLEQLSGNREGQFSIRINDQYRICFEWSERGPLAVEIADYHRG